MGAFPLGKSPWTSYSSFCKLRPVEVSDEFSIASNVAADFSFGAPYEDELSSFDAELSAMLAWAAANISLEWNTPPCPECSRLDDWFLGSEPTHSCTRPQCPSSQKSMKAGEVVEGIFYPVPLSRLFHPHYPQQ